MHGYRRQYAIGVLWRTLLMLALSACISDGHRAEIIRPVKAMTVGVGAGAEQLKLPGHVKARVESVQGFRVGGRMTLRHVDVGDVVTRDQVLAQLDPSDQRLGSDAASAAVSAAQAALAIAQDDLARARDLQARRFISQAELDHHIRGVEAARARVREARANAALAARSVDYTRLRAASDAVVTMVLAEPGQVLAPGQPVMVLARPEEKEVEVTIGEDQVARLRRAKAMSVALWAVPGRMWSGRLRALSPSAEPLTRTYTARIAFDADETVHLGMSATVSVAVDRGDSAVVLPLAALIADNDQHTGSSAVWVVGRDERLVRTRVFIDGFEGNQVRVASGLEPGQQVVIAGARALRDGQQVRILEADPA